MAKDKVYMKGFKGFGPGMVCEPNSEHRKEYKENTTYEEEGGKICGSGVMHFCENPLDVLSFYPPVNDSGKLNEYATVEALAPVESDENKEKSCTKKLHIGVKLSLNELLKAAIDFTWSKVDKSKEQTIIFRQQSSNSGDYSVSSNSGNCSVSSVEGKESVAVATGRESKVKGKIGCWIACAEWGFVDGEWHIIDFQSTKVDGKTIKEDVFYILKNGKFEETV